MPLGEDQFLGQANLGQLDRGGLAPLDQRGEFRGEFFVQVHPKRLGAELGNRHVRPGEHPQLVSGERVFDLSPAVAGEPVARVVTQNGAEYAVAELLDSGGVVRVDGIVKDQLPRRVRPGQRGAAEHGFDGGGVVEIHVDQFLLGPAHRLHESLVGDKRLALSEIFVDLAANAGENRVGLLRRGAQRHDIGSDRVVGQHASVVPVQVGLGAGEEFFELGSAHGHRSTQVLCAADRFDHVLYKRADGFVFAGFRRYEARLADGRSLDLFANFADLLKCNLFTVAGVESAEHLRGGGGDSRAVFDAFV